jgi:hypothetical protein
MNELRLDLVNNDQNCKNDPRMLTNFSILRSLNGDGEIDLAYPRVLNENLDGPLRC